MELLVIHCTYLKTYHFAQQKVCTTFHFHMDVMAWFSMLLPAYVSLQTFASPVGKTGSHCYFITCFYFYLITSKVDCGITLPYVFWPCLFLFLKTVNLIFVHFPMGVCVLFVMILPEFKILTFWWKGFRAYSFPVDEHWSRSICSV